MLTEDHIMRMLRLTVAALAKIVGLKAALLYQDARYLIDQSIEQIFGMRADLVRRLDDQSLLSALTFQEILDVDRVYLVAELFREEAEILILTGSQIESTPSYLRALNFYLESALGEADLNFPDPGDKIASILARLAGDDLPPDTLYPLFCYYEDKGRFDLAESTLAELSHDPDSREEIQNEFKQFYRRLLERPDEMLASGGLPRNIVESRLAGL